MPIPISPKSLFFGRAALSDLLAKLSSYNLFNYLLPGVLFCAIADGFFGYDLVQKDIVIGVFLYYFVGLVVSRVGSVLIEPVLKKIGFVTFASYSDYVAAEAKDPKIETLSEANNMYRTLVALLASLFLLAGYNGVVDALPELNHYTKYIALTGLLVLFLCAYRKQTNFLRQRVERQQGKGQRKTGGKQ